jgi:phospholipase C
VSFLKAAAFEDAHPSNSDPLDEQRFVARTLDALEQSPDWKSTAVVVAYDDSDGWYDHQMSPIDSPSNGSSDQLNGPGKCGNVKANSTAYNDRCGLGPRQPLLIISPYAKQNYVDHSISDQSSIIKFVEDNWQLGRIGDQSTDATAGDLGTMFNFDPNAKAAPKVFIDPTSGEVLKTAPSDGPVAPQSQTAATPSIGSDVSAEQTADAYRNSGADFNSTQTTVAGKAAKLKLSCTTAGGGKKVSVSCSGKGSDVGNGTTALRFRIARGAHVFVTARTTLSKAGTAKLTLRPAHALEKGKYTLRIAIARAGGVTGISQSVEL